MSSGETPGGVGTNQTERLTGRRGGPNLKLLEDRGLEGPDPVNWDAGEASLPDTVSTSNQP